MSTMMTVPADTPKTVAVMLTLEIQAWLRSESKRRKMSVSAMAREIFEKAMDESKAKGAA